LRPRTYPTQVSLRHGTRAKEQGRTPGSLTTSTGAAVDSASMLLRCFNSHVLSSLLELVFQHHGTWGSYASKPEGPTQQVWGVSPRCKAACAVSPDTTRRIRHGVSSFARCAHTRTHGSCPPWVCRTSRTRASPAGMALCGAEHADLGFLFARPIYRSVSAMVS